MFSILLPIGTAFAINCMTFTYWFKNVINWEREKEGEREFTAVS